MQIEVFPEQRKLVTLRDAVIGNLKGESRALEQIMRTHNQRLFRIARSILNEDAEAEDVVQETFMKAFSNADELQDEERISGWLCKITVNLCRDRLRRRGAKARIFSPANALDFLSIEQDFQIQNDKITSPERQAAMGDVRRMIECEIAELPSGFREVFVLRVVEQMSIIETASVLNIPEGTVKTRLHRAKSLMRVGLEGRLDLESLKVFPFGGIKCSRTTQNVIMKLRSKG